MQARRRSWESGETDGSVNRVATGRGFQCPHKVVKFREYLPLLTMPLGSIKAMFGS